MSQIVFQIPLLVVVEGGEGTLVKKGLSREELQRKIESSLRNEIRPRINVVSFWEDIPVHIRTILGIDSVREWFKDEQNEEHKSGF